MATFFMFGKYSPEALKGISRERTKKAAKIIKKARGQVKGMYALMGERDLVLIADFPGAEQALKASVALSKMSGIGFSTSQALPVEQFDRLVK